MIGVPACRSITGWDADPLLEKFKSSDFFHKGAMMVAGFQTVLVTCVFYLDVLKDMMTCCRNPVAVHDLTLHRLWAVKLYIHLSSHSSTTKILVRSAFDPEHGQKGGVTNLEEEIERYKRRLIDSC